MTARKCVCDQPVQDRFVCEGCEVRCRHNLTELVDLNAELHVALARMARMSERGEGGRSAETALAYGQAAGDRLRLNRDTLAAWVHAWHTEQGGPKPVNLSTPTLVDWLTHRLPEAARHRADIGDMCDEVRDCRIQSQRVVDLPVNRTAYEVGPCPEDTEDGPCLGMVWAVIPADETRRPRMECRGCRMVWYAEQFAHAGRRILARKASA